MQLQNVAPAVAVLSWLAFFLILGFNHFRVRGARSDEIASGEYRAPASMWGLLLEGLGIAIVFTFRRPVEATPMPLALAACLLAPAALIFAAAAALRLGRHWRIKAVVTQNHELVTTGPFAIVRHPIYLAMFVLGLATALAISHWLAGVIGLLIYLLGTEIRVRAEDGILRRRFGARFEEYQRRVPAYMPFVR
jgi:protein-S-isoprenylcysteine O-methyltransferase Ste14